MSRPISESLSLLSETLGNCKTNLKEKEVADVDNIKISDVDEKIAEIKSGGGGIDWDNPKYMTINPKETFWTYDVMEATMAEYELKVTFDLSNYDYDANFYFLTNNIDIEVVDENSNFQGNWNNTKSVIVRNYSPITKKIKFKGKGVNPVFFIVMSSAGTIEDISKIDVRNS